MSESLLQLVADANDELQAAADALARAELIEKQIAFMLDKKGEKR